MSYTAPLKINAPPPTLHHQPSTLRDGHAGLPSTNPPPTPQVMLVGFAVLNGQSSWLIGVLLMAAYFSLAAAFFVHVDPPDVIEEYVVGGAEYLIGGPE